MRAWSVVASVLLAPVVSFAQEPVHHPRGYVRVQGWEADVDEDGGAREGGALRARLDLSETLRLDAAFARTLSGVGAGGDFGYSQLSWRALRAGGGLVDDDYGLHVGVAPRFGADLAPWLWLEGGADLALGIGWLGDRDDEDAGPADEEAAVWRSASSGGIDLYAGSGALDLAVRLRPHAAVELVARAYADAFLVAARPGDTEPLPGALASLSQSTDLGLSATLSQGAVGGHGQASLRLARTRSRGEAWLRYREAWDWIHLDPVYTVLARTDPFDDVHLADVPWRVTRSVELEATRPLGPRGQLAAAVDVRHRSGSTTTQDFADRDGWSIGARVSARYRRVFGGASVRWHLDDSPLEPLLGPMPRAQLSAQAGVIVVSRSDLDLALEAGLELGRQDDWGIPRAGQAAWGALTVTFGGARDAFTRDLLERSLTLPPLPRRGDPATARVALTEVDASSFVASAVAPPTITTPTLASSPPAAPAEAGAAAVAPPTVAPGLDVVRDLLDLTPEEAATYEGDARDAGLLDGRVRVEDIRTFVDDPDVAGAIEERLPGLPDLLDRVLTDQGAGWRVDGQALLAEPDSVVFAGYGADSAGVGVSWRSKLTASRTWSLRRRSTDAEAAAEVQAALAPDDDDLLGSSTTLHLGGVLDLARARRWHKLTVAAPDGDDRHRIVFQGATGWTRAMRLLLSGR